MSNLLTTAEQAQMRATAQPPISQFVANVNVAEGAKDEDPKLNIFGKINLLLQKEVIKDSKIKWLHVVLVAVAYVGYVEFVADRQRKRKLKFW